MAIDRFEIIPGGDDLAIKPKLVINKTAENLQLFQSGNFPDPTFLREYFRDYTLPFLESAARGVKRVYTRDQQLIDSQSTQANEAADLAFVVFAWMHALQKSEYLPMGFSRRGMLQAPQSEAEFRKRLNEMSAELALIATGGRRPLKKAESVLPFLRTLSFFEVGSIIPVHMPDDGSEGKERNEEQHAKSIERIERADIERMRRELKNFLSQQD